MDLFSSISSLTDGQATKPPTFSGGYISRTDIPKNQNDTWDEKFKLTFVKHSSGGSTPTSYEFTVTRTGQDYSVVVPQGGYSLDAQMFASMFFSTDWSVGKTSDFESARTGRDW